MRQELAENLDANGTPPQCSKQGTKNDHSPWSAPRERKRRNKPVEVALTSIEEIEYATSPPKRHNGGSSPAARDLGLQEAPLGSPFAVDRALAAAVEAGPLAQGLCAAGDPACRGDALFSPLASGMVTTSFTSSTQHDWQLTGDKQRKQLRQAAAFRLATSRQRVAAAAAAAAAAAVVDAPAYTSYSKGPAGDPFELGPASIRLPAQLSMQGADCLPQQSVPGCPAEQSLALVTQHPHHQHLRLGASAANLPGHHWCEAGELPPLAAHQPHQQEQLGAAGTMVVAACGTQLGGSPGQPCGASWYSTGHDMETDVRASWSSDLPAEEAGQPSLQSRLHHAAANAPRRPLPDSGGPSGGMLRDQLPGLAALGAALAVPQRQPSAADDPMRVSIERALSTCSSMDGPSCSERQTSMVPLRSGGPRSHQWQSHLASSPLDTASPEPLLGQGRGGASGRRRSRGAGSGIAKKFGCFSCASPFSSCRKPGQQQQQDESDEEVVRRNDSEDFVIRCKESLTPCATSRGIADRPKHTTLNRPPSGQDREAAAREAAFSARCSPGIPWSSPCSEAGSGDSFSLASAPGLRPTGLQGASITDLAGSHGDGEGGPPPSVDALNDMLKSLSLCPTSHPKDAEEMVAKACQDHAIQPNATTARTLEKLWAVHEQLYG